MPLTLVNISTAPAGADGLWDKSLDSLLFPILLALAIYLGKSLATWRSARSANRQAFAGLRSEIARVHAENERLRKILEVGFSSGELQRKMRADARYFIYIAQGRSTHQVFDTKARDFSFLDDRCFELLVDYYDTQSLLTACLTDMRSDAFRDLSIPRKEEALKNILGLLTENRSTYAECQTSFESQAAYLQAGRKPGNRKDRKD